MFGRGCLGSSTALKPKLGSTFRRFVIFLTASEVNSVFDAKCPQPTDDVLSE